MTCPGSALARSERQGEGVRVGAIPRPAGRIESGSRPRSSAVARLVDDVPAAQVAAVALPASRPAAAVPAPDLESVDVDEDQELALENLTVDQVRQWRVQAMKDHQVVFDHIDRYGEPSARRLFSNQVVTEAQHLSGLGHLNLGYTTWGQA